MIILTYETPGCVLLMHTKNGTKKQQKNEKTFKKVLTLKTHLMYTSNAFHESGDAKEQ